MTQQLDKVLYTARTHTTGGREGAARSDDGKLDIQLSAPGSSGTGTNPEQLFAAGYSACFIGALKAVAARQKISLPQDLSVDAEVDLGPVGQAYGIAVRMTIRLPGMDHAQAQQLVDAAHEVCPYSNATRGNVPVTLTVAWGLRLQHRLWLSHVLLRSQVKPAFKVQRPGNIAAAIARQPQRIGLRSMQRPTGHAGLQGLQRLCQWQAPAVMPQRDVRHIVPAGVRHARHQCLMCDVQRRAVR